MSRILENPRAKLIGGVALALAVLAAGAAVWRPDNAATLTPPPLAGAATGTNSETHRSRTSVASKSSPPATAPGESSADVESSAASGATTAASGAGATTPFSADAASGAGTTTPSSADAVAAPQPATPQPVAPPVQLAVVHVAGRVRAPNVYALPPTARIFDAVQKAGGCLSDADTDAVNLAARIQDGEQIYIPRRGAAAQMAYTGAPAFPVPAGRVPPAGPAAAFAVAPTGRPQIARAAGSRSAHPRVQKLKDPSQGTIDLNSAPAEQLVLLPGVGPSTAEKILEFRRTNGRFTTVQDIMNVKGIGPAKFQKMQPYLTVR